MQWGLYLVCLELVMVAAAVELPRAVYTSKSVGFLYTFSETGKGLNRHIEVKQGDGEKA